MLTKFSNLSLEPLDVLVFQPSGATKCITIEGGKVYEAYTQEPLSWGVDHLRMKDLRIDTIR